MVGFKIPRTILRISMHSVFHGDAWGRKENEAIELNRWVMYPHKLAVNSRVSHSFHIIITGLTLPSTDLRFYSYSIYSDNLI